MCFSPTPVSVPKTFTSEEKSEREILGGSNSLPLKIAFSSFLILSSKLSLQLRVFAHGIVFAADRFSKKNRLIRINNDERRMRKKLLPFLAVIIKTSKYFAGNLPISKLRISLSNLIF